MNKTIHIEICKSEYVDNAFNLRIGDIKGAIEHSNISEKEVLFDIEQEIKELNSQETKSNCICGKNSYSDSSPDTFSTTKSN